MDIVTCSAPINIAIIKYWGKQCQKLNIPLNDSFSITLHQDDLKALTTAATSVSYEEDKVWLNSNEIDINTNSRLVTCLNEIRKLAREQAQARGENDQELKKYNQKVHICSRNNFPTAAGLASSAAGYAALVASLGQLFNVDGDLSAIARRGSGSACRSMYGGFVEWTKGVKEKTGIDSFAIPYLPDDHWPGLCVFILVISGRRKETGSTEGMQRSVETSSFLQHRATNVVPRRMKEIKEAVKRRDFHSFAEICMRESNQLHAVCRDTFPPLQYLNEISQNVISFVDAYNRNFAEHRLAYTYDAGPNAFLFTPKEFRDDIARLIFHYFGPASDEVKIGQFIRGFDYNSEQATNMTELNFQPHPGKVEYVIFTKPGPGPISLSAQHLINPKTGLPS